MLLGQEIVSNPNCALVPDDAIHQYIAFTVIA
jgi:hypothetical protein